MEYRRRFWHCPPLVTPFSTSTRLVAILSMFLLTSPSPAFLQTTHSAPDKTSTSFDNLQTVTNHEHTPKNSAHMGITTEPQAGLPATLDPSGNKPRTGHRDQENATLKPKYHLESTSQQTPQSKHEDSEADRKPRYERENETATLVTCQEDSRNDTTPPSQENVRKNTVSSDQKQTRNNTGPCFRPQGKSQPANRPNGNGQDSSCSSQELTDTEGQVVWTESRSGGCPVYHWHITVPDGSGIVFEFHSIEMSNNLTVTIHEFNSQTSTDDNSSLWTYSSEVQYNVMAPLLVRINRVTLEVRRSFDGQTVFRRNPSSFNISYAAHPVEFMPQEVQVDEGDGFRTSSVMYNCSVHPKNIPKGLQCDMVQQCVAGEDEEDCSYKDTGCGDWIPYRDTCIKAFFKSVTGRLFRNPSITMPLRAEYQCRINYHAKLATLPDELGIRLAGDILWRSGYQSAAVNLRRMRPKLLELRQLYKYLWQWGKPGSPVAHEQVKIQRDDGLVDCASYDLREESFLRAIPCNAPLGMDTVPDGFFCRRSNTVKHTPLKTKPSLELRCQTADDPVPAFPTKTCPDGSLVQVFHDCAWNKFGMSPVASVSPFPRFHCQTGNTVHYSSLCDDVNDCADSSDEINCITPRLQPTLSEMFVCVSSQTIPRNNHCNGINDCFDNSDEEDCIRCRVKTILCPVLGCVPEKYTHYFSSCSEDNNHRPDPPVRVFSPAAVVLDGFGMSQLKPAGQLCEEGYFKCDNGLCIPSFLVNNEEKDCPSGIDESIPMENLTCPGYYRCLHYGNCLHSRYLCDGIPHCPYKDDERYCDISCPQNCTCEGYAYKCRSMLDPAQYLNTRYLDVSGVSQPLLDNIHVMERLRFLNLSHCQLKYVKLTNMTQLEILDLSFNQLVGLQSIHFFDLTGLKRLSLSHNPLMTEMDGTFRQFVTTSGLTHLTTLSMVDVGLNSIQDGVIGCLTQLTDLDLRQNDITDFDKYVFSGLVHLKKLQADNYKLCCPYFQEAKIAECVAPEDELSSCGDLLNNEFYQVFVWVQAVLNIPANMAVLVYRLVEVKNKTAKSYTILVANLCLSDLLMGIYLLFIASADVHYRGKWVSRETEWTSSWFCCFAGVLAFLSNEVSAFVVCLITLERLLVICFPLRSALHMTNRSTSLACAVSWFLGLLLATMPMMVGRQVYGQTGFCLPLPITRNQFPGQKYVFAVFVCVNFVLFIFIGMGQMCIYRAIKNNRLSSSCQSKLRDTTIARRLMLIIITDLICWFPIGIMAVLSSLGTPIPGLVNVWAAIFILPINSALNPHLYTLNTVMDQYREHRMNRRIQKTIGKINAEIAKWPADKVESLLKTCLQAGVVPKKQVQRWLKVNNGGEDGGENGGKNRKEDLQWIRLDTSKEDSEELPLDIAKTYDFSPSDKDVSPSHTQTKQCT